jgi:hypothetical protein
MGRALDRVAETTCMAWSSFNVDTLTIDSQKKTKEGTTA